MKQTRLLMGMPVSVEIVDPHVTAAIFDEVYAYFSHIDEKFSTYKPTSEIEAINAGALKLDEASEEMRLVFTLSEETKRETDGYFDIRRPDGRFDPSGLVKGWAIGNAAQLIAKRGFENFYVDAGGDIQTQGHNADGGKWAVGVKNPFDQRENVKVVYISGEGMATSGTYIRGRHIYDPHAAGADKRAPDDIVSLTVIGPTIHDADRFATAAFAMGAKGIAFIESLPGFEGYMIDRNKIATMTTHFDRYTRP